MKTGRLAPWLAAMTLLAASAAGAEEASRPLPPAAGALLLDGARAGTRMVVVGARGHILISDDEAGSWRQAASPTRAMLTAIHMREDGLGWAVGHDAVILRTRDGGETWRLIHRAPEEERPLLDVHFSDARNGLAIGAYGYLLATEDGGETWTSRAADEDDYHLNALAAAEGRLYMAAEAGAAYRSDDGGESWRRLAPPYGGSWFGAAALDADTVLLVGLRGHMVRSTDGGESWTQVPTGTTATLTGIERLPSGRIVVTGLEGALLESRDGGRSVVLRRLPGRAGISDALALGHGGLLLVGEFGVHRLPPTR